MSDEKNVYDSMNDLINDALVKDIIALDKVFLQDLVSSTQGNKSAARRARVNSVKLEKLYKQFRKDSVKK